MYILKNAWKSIVRTKSRNILIGVVLLVIAVASCVALSIKSSADGILQNTKDSYQITATLGVNRQAMMQAAQQSSDSSSSGQKGFSGVMSEITSPTIDEIKKYGDSQYLSGYSYTLSASLNSSTISPLTNNTSSSSSSSSSFSAAAQQPSKTQQMPGGENFRANQGDFRFEGYSSTSAMSQFVSGTYKIVNGAMFEDADTSNVCVISDELASENSLSVGSTITFTNPKDETQTWDFKVVGIYQDTSVDESSAMNFFSNAANQIITNYSALNNIVTTASASEDTTIQSQLSSAFYLKDAASVEPFTAELTSKGLSQYYTVSTNATSLDESLKPLNNLNHFATIFLILVLAIGGVILVVVNMINIRERKYEVGVLRAIGMKKSKVLFQYVSEFFMVTFLSLIIGAVVGSCLSVPTANMMLKSEIESQQQSTQQVNQNFGRQGSQSAQGGQTMTAPGTGRTGGMSDFFNRDRNVSYISQINAVMSPIVVLQLAGIGILLTLLSSGISVILISRYEPLRILSNRT